MAQHISTGTFGCAKWIVDPTAGQGTHTTLTSALASASSGDTIFIRPGTYTENPSLKAGVNLTAFTGDSIDNHVTIVGKCTATFTGSCVISNIELKTNSDYCLSVSGSNATIVYLDNCNIACSNNTGIQFSTSSSSASITCYNCGANIGTTGISLYTSSSPSTLWFSHCDLLGGGTSTTPSSTSSGNVSIVSSEIGFPLSTSSTGSISIYNTYLDTNATGSNAVILTTAGTGSAVVRNCTFISGTGSCVSAGAGTIIDLENSSFASSNTNAITGAGTVQIWKYYF